MVTLPSQLLVSTGLGLAALIVLIFALALLGAAYRRRTFVTQTLHREVIASHVQNRGRLLVPAAVVLLILVFGGHYFIGMLRPPGVAPPSNDRTMTGRVKGASGADLTVETFGPADAPVIIFTHGWGADRQEWVYYRSLADRYRLVVWDLPGLGESTPIPDGYTMTSMASDLASIVAATGDRPVILVGHSVGGMLNLEYFRLLPQHLGGRIKGIVEFNTTYTNPLRTTKDAERHLAMQKPLYEPLLHVVEVTSPFIRAMGWLSYTSGLAHLQLAIQSFAGTETREQLDHAAQYAYRSSPAVVAAGVRAMMNWDATATLPKISVPTLIVAGAQDTTTLPQASIVMQRAIGQSKLTTIDLAAHLGPIEQHERYLAELRGFAERAFGTRSTGSTPP